MSLLFNDKKFSISDMLLFIHWVQDENTKKATHDTSLSIKLHPRSRWSHCMKLRVLDHRKRVIIPAIRVKPVKLRRKYGVFRVFVI